MRSVTLVLLLAFIVGASVFGYRSRRVLSTALTAAALLGVAWMLAAAAVWTHWRDADGTIDCNQSCTNLQEAVGILYFGIPLAVAILLVLALASFVVRRRHRIGG
jgi:ribose/xylose/arabinose/galactoside ABC-type transport system permease subunit